MSPLLRHRSALGFGFRLTCVATMVAFVAGSTANLSYGAFLITSSHILPVPTSTVESGNGTLDFILFTESSGGSGNSSGSFDGDNANTQMPTGSGNTTADESYITSFGEIRAFYRLNFPDGFGGSRLVYRPKLFARHQCLPGGR
jgi:hypothetical protein